MNMTRIANSVARRVLAESGSKEEYEKYFEKKLKKWKVKSPSELSKEDKKKFFEEVDKGWDADKE